MNEELLLTLDSINQSLRNEQPFGLTRLLWERVGRESWALFRLDNNSHYDDTLPQWDGNGTHGSFYAFFWSVPQGGMSIRDKCTISEMNFFESDVAAVRWALEMASKLTPESDLEMGDEKEEVEIPF